MSGIGGRRSSTPARREADPSGQVTAYSHRRLRGEAGLLRFADAKGAWGERGGRWRPPSLRSAWRASQGSPPSLVAASVERGPSGDQSIKLLMELKVPLVVGGIVHFFELAPDALDGLQNLFRFLRFGIVFARRMPFTTPRAPLRFDPASLPQTNAEGEPPGCANCRPSIMPPHCRSILPRAMGDMNVADGVYGHAPSMGSVASVPRRCGFVKRFLGERQADVKSHGGGGGRRHGRRPCTRYCNAFLSSSDERSNTSG